MRLALIGAGLIGGSAAWAWRQAGWCQRVAVYDRDPAAAARAVELGVADRAADSVAAAAEEADAVLLAVPVLAMAEVFAALAPVLRPGVMVSDVGSVRGAVIAAARQSLGPRFAAYAPVHPIAGGEMPGIDYASADLFCGAKAISTPCPDMSDAAISFWEEAWRAAGAEVRRMSPEEHDEIFAMVSHLPHALAYTLVETVALSPEAGRKFGLVGAGFRDFTRIAASSPRMWLDICLANREAILAALAAYRGQLSRFERALKEGDGDELVALMSHASGARRAVYPPRDPRDGEKR